MWKEFLVGVARRLGGSRLVHDGLVAGLLGLAGLEAVLEAAGHVLEVAGASGADGLPALGLLTPVDCSGDNTLALASPKTNLYCSVGPSVQGWTARPDRE